MTIELSPQDWEALSAYIDNQLNPRERKRLEIRLQASENLRIALDELRRTRRVLRGTPRLRAPRNFTLTPMMAGVRPVRTRLYPVFRLAFAMASVLFVLAFAGDLFTVTSGGGSSLDVTAPDSLTVQQSVEVEIEAAAAPIVADDQEGIEAELEFAVWAEAQSVAPTKEPALERGSTTNASAMEAEKSEASPTPKLVVEEKVTPKQQPIVISDSFQLPWRALEVLFGGIALVSGLVVFFLRREVR